MLTRRQLAWGVFASLWGFSPLEEITALLNRASNPGWFAPPDIDACVVDVRYPGNRCARAFGRAASPDARFVISSISKPIVATAIMVLQDRKLLNLQDRVSKFLPGFRGDSKDEITIQQLLTHSAGLPDSLPNMHDLRRQHATLEAMFAETCKVSLLFRPGSAFSYSNLGVLVAKEILERLTNVSLREFLSTEVFRPLSMKASSLGLPVGSTVLRNQPRPDKIDLNTAADLGAPWGGVCSTASDMTRFLHYFVNPSGPPLRPETASSMLWNHNSNLQQPWGIGWMLANSHDAYYNVAPTWRRYGWAALWGNPERMPAFGLDCSTRTFGHYGVTGTLAWADPVRHISVVLLTTKPVRHSRDGVLGPVSDIASRLP